MADWIAHGDASYIELKNARIRDLESQLTALKLAATEQATQAEAVLEERARERDALSLSQGRLLGALNGVMTLIEEGKLVRDIRGDGEPDWAIKQMPLVVTLQQARAAIAEATPE